MVLTRWLSEASANHLIALHQNTAYGWIGQALRQGFAALGQGKTHEISILAQGTIQIHEILRDSVTDAFNASSSRMKRGKS